jgi:hypothetical protein
VAHDSVVVNTAASNYSARRSCPALSAAPSSDAEGTIHSVALNLISVHGGLDDPA